MSATDINTSQLRLYYLQQLGIAAYVPRDVSPVGDVDEVRTVETVETVSAKVLPQQEAVPALIRRVQFEPDVITPPATPAPATVTTAAVVEVDTDTDITQPFQLLLAVIDTELAVAIQIPALATAGLREHEQKLLQNLLRWLGYPLPDMKSVLQYRWPLPGLPANSAAMATRTLSVFLQQAASTRPFRHLMLLGPIPAQCLQDQRAEWHLWPTHSLAELLALPQLKRDTWLQLQPLQRELQQKQA